MIPAPRLVAAFLDWLDARNCTRHVSVEPVVGQGLGLIAMRDILPNDAVITIPMHTVITASRTTEGRYGALASAESDDERFALFLMRERARGSASPWAPWIAVLPPIVSAAWTWSSFERDALQEEQVAWAARQMQLEVMRSYSALQDSGLLRANFAQIDIAAANAAWVALHDTEATAALTPCDVPTLDDDVSILLMPTPERKDNSSVDGACKRGLHLAGFAGNHTSLASYAWARSIVASRGLTISGRRHLAPLVDMTNYAPAPLEGGAIGAVRQYGGVLHVERHHRVTRAGGLTVLADRRVFAGQQLSRDYGDESNEHWVVRHGFVESSCPFDCARPRLPVLSETAAPIAAALGVNGAVNRSCLLLPEESLAVSSLDAALMSIPKSVLLWLSLANATVKELALCRGAIVREGLRVGALEEGAAVVYVEFGARDDQLLPYNVRRASAAAACLSLFDAAAGARRVAHALRETLAAYPTSLEADEVALYDAERGEEAATVRVPSPMVLALRFRVVNKRRHATVAAVLEKLAAVHAVDKTSSVVAETAPEVASSEPVSLSPVGHDVAENDADVASFADPDLVARIDRFNAWFVNGSDGESLPLPCHVRAVAARGNYRVGVIATAPISLEEPYLGVPLARVMDVRGSASNDDIIGPVLDDLRVRYGGDDGRGRDDLHELLFHLLVEARVRGRRRVVQQQRRSGPKAGGAPKSNGAVKWLELDQLVAESRFRPYIDVLPTLDELRAKLPLLWSMEEIEVLLNGSAVREDVVTYKRAVDKAWDGISRAVLALYPAAFPAPRVDRDAYLWARAILDSRAIWWDGVRHLVPMLDLVNCAGPGGNNASRVHRTTIERYGGASYAVIRADRTFAPGTPISEHYGQPNALYFTYHGVSLVDNPADCVRFIVRLPRDEVDATLAYHEGVADDAATATAAASNQRKKGKKGRPTRRPGAARRLREVLIAPPTGNDRAPFEYAACVSPHVPLGEVVNNTEIQPIRTPSVSAVHTNDEAVRIVATAISGSAGVSLAEKIGSPLQSRAQHIIRIAALAALSGYPTSATADALSILASRSIAAGGQLNEGEAKDDIALLNAVVSAAEEISLPSAVGARVALTQRRDSITHAAADCVAELFQGEAAINAASVAADGGVEPTSASAAARAATLLNQRQYAALQFRALEKVALLRLAAPLLRLDTMTAAAGEADELAVAARRVAQREESVLRCVVETAAR